MPKNNVKPKSIKERFEALVIVQDGCWDWKASKFRSGYARFAMPPPTRHSVVAHRVSYELYKGPIPDGLLVCHTCDNPACTNPDHLFLGTHSDNVQDMLRKGRNNPQRGDKHYRRRKNLNDMEEFKRAK